MLFVKPDGVAGILMKKTRFGTRMFEAHMPKISTTLGIMVIVLGTPGLPYLEPG